MPKSLIHLPVIVEPHTFLRYGNQTSKCCSIVGPLGHIHKAPKVKNLRKVKFVKFPSCLFFRLFGKKLHKTYTEFLLQPIIIFKMCNAL